MAFKSVNFILIKTLFCLSNVFIVFQPPTGISIVPLSSDVRAVSGDFSEDFLDVGHRLALQVQTRLASLGKKHSRLCSGIVESLFLK